MHSIVEEVEAGRSASAADYLRAVAPSIPAKLIDASCVGDITSVLSPFPGALSTYFLLECRLGTPVASSDCSIMLSAADGGRSVVGGKMRGVTMPEVVSRDPAWSRIMAFLKQWAQPESPFYQSFDHIWLEFDTSGDAATRDVPSIFFSPREGGKLGLCSAGDDGMARDARELISRAVTILAGENLAEEDAARLRWGMERIPAGAFLSHVGVMCSRRPASLRLVLSHVSPDDLIGFLGDIGWAGDVQQLRGEIGDLEPRVDGITYAVEIHEGIGARVGMECYIHDDDWRTANERWPEFIEYLIGRGLCLPEKGAALLGYPGITHKDSGTDVWPSNLASAGAFFRGRLVPVLVRTIHHVKVSFVGDSLVEAKAYPGLSLGWIHRG